MLDEKLIGQIDLMAKESVDNTILMRRSLHKIPEIGNDLPKTRALILQELQKYPVEVRENVGENGIVALLRGAQPGKTVAYRADMDALPIQEEIDCEYKSEHAGAMHACGHDAHVALALSILHVLSNVREQIKGNVKFIFQPAEETVGGAKPMIEDGALENPKVDYVFGSHVWPDVESGKIGLRKGPLMAGTDVIELLIHGKGGHAAMPHAAINTLVVGSKIVGEVEAIKNYFVHSQDRLVISLCSMKAGETYNVIPDQCKITGTVRYFAKEAQDIVVEKVQAIVDNVSAIYGAQCDLDYKKNYPATVNDADVISSVEAILEQHDMGERIFPIKTPYMGAEDFSFFLQEVPGAYFFIGTANAQKGTVYPLHNPKFTVDENIFAFATPTLSKIILEFLDK